MKKNESSSVLLSIFRRKGSEGLYTKIITDENKVEYFNQLNVLEKSEIPLVCFKQNDLYWVLLTTNRIIQEESGVKLFIPFSELIDINLALELEFKDNVLNKKDFTRMILTTKNGLRHVMKIESGESFNGIYQILHHLVSKNRIR